MTIQPERKIEIESIAKDVLRETFEAEIKWPLDLEKIIEKNGVKLQKVEFKSSEDAGAYDKTTRTILVNAADSYFRKAFTIAHELGHLFLHQDLSYEVLKRSTTTSLNGDLNILEKEANWFAACLLMPREQFINTWNLTSGDKRLLSSYFGVSEQSVFWRARSLGLA